MVHRAVVGGVVFVGLGRGALLFVGRGSGVLVALCQGVYRLDQGGSASC
jgi:hypothetical protein